MELGYMGIAFALEFIVRLMGKEKLSHVLLEACPSCIYSIA